MTFCHLLVFHDFSLSNFIFQVFQSLWEHFFKFYQDGLSLLMPRGGEHNGKERRCYRHDQVSNLGQPCNRSGPFPLHHTSPPKRDRLLKGTKSKKSGPNGRHFQISNNNTNILTSKNYYFHQIYNQIILFKNKLS